MKHFLNLTTFVSRETSRQVNSSNVPRETVLKDVTDQIAGDRHHLYRDKVSREDSFNLVRFHVKR